MKEFRTDRFVWNEGDVQITHPDQLQCANCVHRIKGSASCTKFQRKPAYVLLRKKECPEYKET